MSGNKKRIKLILNNLTLSKVGVAGFEPTTSSSRTTRATGLRYTPFCKTAANLNFFTETKTFHREKSSADYN